MEPSFRVQVGSLFDLILESFFERFPTEPRYEKYWNSVLKEPMVSQVSKWAQTMAFFWCTFFEDDSVIFPTAFTSKANSNYGWYRYNLLLFSPMMIIIMRMRSKARVCWPVLLHGHQRVQRGCLNKVISFGGAMNHSSVLSWAAIISDSRKFFRHRWSQGLLFHQALVDCARAAILMPLGTSILNCKPVNKCSLVETAFLLLVTVSTVNLLTTVLNDAPVLPDDDDGEDALPMLMDSPQCVVFGMFMIW